jgi:hypothetical protein
MPYTKHGHWYGLGAPAAPQPRLVVRCGGPHLCTDCALEAQLGDPDSVGRPQMPLSVGGSPDDVARLMAMLRVVGQFGHRLGRICDDALEGLAAAPASAAADTEARQRVDDPPEDPGG